jgi:hypothetical protein
MMRSIYTKGRAIATQCAEFRATKHSVEWKTKEFLQLLQHQWPLGEEVLEVAFRNSPQIKQTTCEKSFEEGGSINH